MNREYELSADLPFGDFAIFNYMLTEEEFNELSELFTDESIWDEDRYEELLSAAATAAANYIVSSYCEGKVATDTITSWSCTLERLMEYLNQDSVYIAEVVASDNQRKREIIAELLYEHQAFCIDLA